MIKFCPHPHPQEAWLARYDHAIVTGQEVMENPWWFENEETGQLYYNIVGCIGWPGEVTARGEGPSGYLGVIGIVKNSLPPEKAVFQILDEYESKDVKKLLYEWIAMRKRWGYGIQPDLLTVLYGDPTRHITARGVFSDEVEEIAITPPVDFFDTKCFDIYVRSLRTALNPESLRLYVGKKIIFSNRVRQFLRDDPAIMAIGGAIHSLVSFPIWMSEVNDNVFSVEEAA